MNDYVGNFTASSVNPNTTVTQAAATEDAATLHLSPNIWSFIIRWSTTLIMSLFSITGNGLTLAVIRMTPDLHTKTNKILASMAASEIFTAINAFFVFAYYLKVYVFGNPCDYQVLDTVMQSVQRMPPKFSVNHLVVAGVDRYVAIVHPLAYEDRMNDRAVNLLLVAAWTLGILVAWTITAWLIDAARSVCVGQPTVVPAWYLVCTDVVHYLVVSFFLAIVYFKILAIARRQQKAIGAAAAVSISAAPSGTPNELEDPEIRRQQDQAKQRQRQLKAFFLTSAVIGTVIVAWFPYHFAVLLMLLGVPVPSDVIDVGIGIGMLNFSFTWVIYAAVSKSFQKAYKQLLIKCFCPAV